MPAAKVEKKLSSKDTAQLLGQLKERFAKNPGRHKDLEWTDVEARLGKNPAKLWSLNEMERSGGEPDVIGRDAKNGEYVFCDCSAETPKDRRSVCYDREGLESRKEHRPENTAV